MGLLERSVQDRSSGWRIRFLFHVQKLNLNEMIQVQPILGEHFN